MAPSARENYLTMEALTAAPQKLQLLLIEAAIRSAQRAGREWQAGRDEQALQSLLHAQAVLAELLRGVKQESNLELTDRVAAVYAFIFRRLVEAGYGRDEAKLADAIRLLEIERADVAAGVPADGYPAARRSGGPTSLPLRGGRTWPRSRARSRFPAAACRWRHEPPRLYTALRRQPYPTSPRAPTANRASVEGSGVAGSGGL